jgi:hypothetical protein
MRHDPLERLRRANPVPADVPAPAIEPLLQRLDGHPPSVPTPARSRVIGHATALVGATVAVAVAVLAVVLIGRGHGDRVSPQVPTTRPGAGGLRALRAEFGVLRRRQNAADLSRQLPAGVPAIRSLTRLAVALPNGDRVYITVHRLVLGRGHATYALDTWLVALGTKRVDQYVAGTPLLVVPWQAALGPKYVTWLSLVPDAVKAVRWTFDGGFVVRPVVEGNVAVARVGRALGAEVPTVAWLGTGNRLLTVVSRVGSNASALAGNGVFGYRFGTPAGDVIARFRALLGSPGQSYTAAPGACNIDHTASWGALVVYFRHDRFVGYQYGSLGTGRARPAPFGAQGLAVGEKVSKAAREFGNAFTLSAAQGGSWSLRTGHGRLFGYASQPGPDGKIATIDAGSVGCPALTP